MVSKYDDVVLILEMLEYEKSLINDMTVYTLLGLMEMSEGRPWNTIRQSKKGPEKIRQFINEHYPDPKKKERYAPNTRENMRDDALAPLATAAIVVKNPDDPNRPTTSPNTCHIISDEALDIFRSIGASDLAQKINSFKKEKGTLSSKYNGRSDGIQVAIPGKTIKLSKGEHNELQKAIMEQFMPHFAPNAKVLYIGDTKQKTEIAQDTELMKKLGIPFDVHDKLPDIILYDESRDMVIFIEAVASANPVTKERKIHLEEWLKNCSSKKVFLTAFPSFKEYKRFIEVIAWETEVWIAEIPNHMIHHNGEKFFTVC